MPPSANFRAGANASERRHVSAPVGHSSVLFVDEIQSLPAWSVWLKTSMDEILRENLSLHLVATGSSALTLSDGSRESDGRAP